MAPLDSQPPLTLSFPNTRAPAGLNLQLPHVPDADLSLSLFPTFAHAISQPQILFALHPLPV